jgi:LacI family transcriptional regulator
MPTHVRTNSGHSASKPRVTIRDVAAQLGISTASVSYALNGSSEVGEDLRERVLSAAEELGYRPNKVAQQLRKGRTDAIGFLIADIANPFYSDVASGVIASASAEGYEVFVSHVGVDGERQSDAATAQLDRNSAGLLFTSVSDRDVTLLENLAKRGVPFVQLHRHLEGLAADSVVVDNYAAARELALHVAETGRRRVAVLGGPETSSVSRNRTAGFRDGLTAGGSAVINDGSIDGALTRESGAFRARDVFKAHPDIDAVVCGNDMIALGVLDACQQLGRRVPDDVAVTGFDDMSFSSAGPLQLTTVTVPRQLMGRRGFELLQRRIHGWKGEPVSEVLPYALQIRATTTGDQR